MKINFLQAKNGDCIIVSFVDEVGIPRNILIDGGTRATFGVKKSLGPLQEALVALQAGGGQIDLLIVTHIDDDHIGGIVQWFKSDPYAAHSIGEVWFNSGTLIAQHLAFQHDAGYGIEISRPSNLNTSIQQGIDFYKMLTELGIANTEMITSGKIFNRWGLKFTILSPSISKLEMLLKEWKKEAPILDTASAMDDYSQTLLDHISSDHFTEDKAVANGSSIAFLLECKAARCLFLADSHPSVVVESLVEQGWSEQNKLKIDLTKVSHHGSTNNTSPDLLSMIECERFAISTNGALHKHPHKQLLGRLVRYFPNCQLCFNYPKLIQQIFNPSDFAQFPNITLVSLERAIQL